MLFFGTKAKVTQRQNVSEKDIVIMTIPLRHTLSA